MTFKTLILLSTALIGCVLTAMQDPPTTGRFFFVDFETGSNIGAYGMHASSLLLGDSR